MESEDVFTCLKTACEIEGEGFELITGSDFFTLGGLGIVDQWIGFVFRGNFESIQVGDKAVIYFHFKHKPVDPGGVIDLERKAKIYRGVFASHRCGQISILGNDVVEQGIISPTNGGMSGSPEVVIESGRLPSAANVFGGNEISKRIADGVEDGVEDGATESVAVGDVGILLGILRAEKGHGGSAVGFDQGEELPINIEAEVGVKRLSGHDSVLAGRVDEEVSIGRNSDVGEGPLSEIGGVVSEVVSID